MGSYSAKSRNENNGSSLKDKVTEKAGAAALEGMGVPKLLADLAIKQAKNGNLKMPGMGKNPFGGGKGNNSHKFNPAGKSNESGKGKESGKENEADKAKQSEKAKDPKAQAADKAKDKLLGKEGGGSDKQKESSKDETSLEGKINFKSPVVIAGISGFIFMIFLPFILILVITSGVETAYGSYNGEDNLYQLNTGGSSSSSYISGTIDSAEVEAITKWDQETAWLNLIGTKSKERIPYVSRSTMDKRIGTVEVPIRRWNSGGGSNPATDTHQEIYKLRANKALLPLWKAFFEDVYNNAPNFVIASMNGCYNYRSVRGGGSLSAHAYAAACDINADTKGNGFKVRSYTKSQWEKLPENRTKYQVVYIGSPVVQIAHKYTLINGADFKSPNDSMHFTYIRDWYRKDIIACQNKVTC